MRSVSVQELEIDWNPVPESSYAKYLLKFPNAFGSTHRFRVIVGGADGLSDTLSFIRKKSWSYHPCAFPAMDELPTHLIIDRERAQLGL